MHVWYATSFKFVETYFMAAPTLEKQFTEYWLKLTTVEKESLLIVARNYIQSREENGQTTINQYNKEIDEAMRQMDEGEFYSHEEVVEASKSWLHSK
jgi:predicted transcriptional regulator